MIYDIFISYRREGGGATAGRINDMLTADGYSVSYDVDTLREGRFDQQLLERIEQCQDFILVVDKNCFVRTIDPATNPQEDWLWQELSYAIQLKRNIIPVLLAGATFPKQLPEDIKIVRDFQCPTCVHEYFDSFYNKLKGYLHAHPRMSRPQYDVPSAQTDKTPCLKIKSNLNCIFFLDDEERMTLKAGKIMKLPLAEGEYELKFVSAENAEDKIVENFRMPAYDKLYSVDLSPIREKRLEQERIAEVARLKVEQEHLERERIAAEEKAKKEAEKKAKAEARRKAKEEAVKKAKEEAVRQARLEEEKRKKEEAEKERRERKRNERERQEEEKKRICRTVSDGLVFNIMGVEFKMVKVEGGSYWMGADHGNYTRTVKGIFGITKEEKYVNSSVRNYDSDAYGSERPVHKVNLSKFYIGEATVTQALWKTVIGSEPTEYCRWKRQYGKGDNYPAYLVSYNDIVNDFLPRLNRLTGKNFRLPTEAEWEYAARGGKKSHGYKYSGGNTIGDVAWYADNSGYATHPVKGKKPNELGLYDMSGNVLEWCQDWYNAYSSSEQTNPTGSSSGSFRVLRGGGWRSGARGCRVSSQNCSPPGFRFNDIGFRLVLPE